MIDPCQLMCEWYLLVPTEPGQDMNINQCGAMRTTIFFGVDPSSQVPAVWMVHTTVKKGEDGGDSKGCQTQTWDDSQGITESRQTPLELVELPGLPWKFRCEMMQPATTILTEESCAW